MRDTILTIHVPMQMTMQRTIPDPTTDDSSASRDRCRTLLANPHATVNDLLADCPRAARVLNAFGVDTCCGGFDTLAEAAVAIGLDVGVLVEALVLTHDTGDAHDAPRAP
jgi:hypothetical protein